MNIGFISYWFERGQAYVTRNLIDAIGEHEAFILARSPGSDMTKSDGEWAHPNLSVYGEYTIPENILLEWIADNKIGIVFFNEEYDFNLVNAVKDTGVKTIGIYYWELFNPAWAKMVDQIYDMVICPTKCCYEKFQKLGMENIEYIPWGVDLSMFKPIERQDNEKIRFFHPAGWGGIHARRGTQFVIDAFRKMDDPDAELLIHIQSGSGVDEDGNIKIVHGTVSRPDLVGMYQQSDVAVLPSKWEGIGLTFPESLACGLPVITVDAPPMNEFVKDCHNGLCVDGDITWYDDIYVPGIHANIDHLAGAMKTLCNPGILATMKKGTIEFSREHLDLSENGSHFRAIIDRFAVDLESETKQAIQSVSDLVEYEYSTPVDDRQYARYDKILADVALIGNVLEIGCKHGTLVFRLAEKHIVTGIDQNADNIKIARSQSLTHPIYGDSVDDHQFRQAAVHSLPFEDDSFDTIIMSKVLEHIEHPEDLYEVVRVLKSTGTIIIVTNLGFAHFDPDHKWFFLPKETCELLRYGWFFKAFPMDGKMVAFEDFISDYFKLPFGYQIYNEHESEHDSLEIYCHIYGSEADFHAFPELRGETVWSEMPLSRDRELIETRSIECTGLECEHYDPVATVEWRECCHPDRYDIGEPVMLSIDCLSDEVRSTILSADFTLASALPLNYTDNGCPLGN